MRSIPGAFAAIILFWCGACSPQRADPPAAGRVDVPPADTLALYRLEAGTAESTIVVSTLRAAVDDDPRLDFSDRRDRVTAIEGGPSRIDFQPESAKPEAGTLALLLSVERWRVNSESHVEQHGVGALGGAVGDPSVFYLRRAELRYRASIVAADGTVPAWKLPIRALAFGSRGGPLHAHSFYNEEEERRYRILMGGDEDLLRHAAERVAERLLAGLQMAAGPSASGEQEARARSRNR